MRICGNEGGCHALASLEVEEVVREMTVDVWVCIKIDVIEVCLSRNGDIDGIVIAIHGKCVFWNGVIPVFGIDAIVSLPTLKVNGV